MVLPTFRSWAQLALMLSGVMIVLIGGALWILAPFQEHRLPTPAFPIICLVGFIVWLIGHTWRWSDQQNTDAAFAEGLEECIEQISDLAHAVDPGVGEDLRLVSVSLTAKAFDRYWQATRPARAPEATVEIHGVTVIRIPAPSVLVDLPPSLTEGHLKVTATLPMVTW